MTTPDPRAAPARDAPDPQAAAGYDACEAAARGAGSSFALGIRLLPRDRRRALSAVYWFSRIADDATDDSENSTRPADRHERLAAVRHDLERALGGTPPTDAWAALADAAARYTMPPRLFHELLDGVARDLEPMTLPDWNAARGYCHGVAGVVGLAALRIFGGDGREAERAAAELGYALQLTNILRDLREDAGRGRWYLPLDETGRFGIDPAEVAGGGAGPGFEALIAVQVERARALYSAGPRLYATLPRATRASPAALVGVYRGLLERIASRPRAVLAERVHLDPPVRWAWALGTTARAMTA